MDSWEEKIMRKVAGKYTLHESGTKNGKLFGQMATMGNLIIKSTSLKRVTNVDIDCLLYKSTDKRQYTG